MEKWLQFGKSVSSESVFKELPLEEQEILKKWKENLLTSASENRAKEGIKEILRFRKIIGVPLNNISHEDIIYFLNELKNSGFGDLTKNKIKSFIKRFLKDTFKDWTIRFDNLKIIKLNKKASRKNPITSKDIISKEELEMLIKEEPKLFWKTFLAVQYFGCLRTIEARSLLWESVEFEDDDFTTLTIISKKNPDSSPEERTLPLPSKVTYFLKELKKRQEKGGIKTKWVFPSPINHKKYISKSVNLWFNKLTKRVLGRAITNYVATRHSYGSELRKMVKNGNLSKDNAIEFMGHSERMFEKVYSHLEKKDVKELMKKQIYNFEYLPEEKKHKLVNEIKELNKRVGEMEKKNVIIVKELADFKMWLPIFMPSKKHIAKQDEKGNLTQKNYP